MEKVYEPLEPSEMVETIFIYLAKMVEKIANDGGGPA